MSALAHIWYKYQKFMNCSKSSVKHLYFMKKKVYFLSYDNETDTFAIVK